jgi:hypothetical protein
MDEGIIGGILVCLVVISIIFGIVYSTNQSKVYFQQNLANMTEYNKCLYICNYEAIGYTGYTTCLDKCDRVNERNCING